MKALKLIVSGAAILVASSVSMAQSISPFFNYQGRGFDTNGTSPLLRTVDFKVQIRSSNGACLLYEESHTGVNLAASNGYFALTIGSLTGDAKRTTDDPSLSMARIFSNTGTVRSSGTGCIGGYAPTPGDKRRLRITIIDNGVSTTLSPDQEILSVPYATVAETLQGVSASGFIQVSGAVTQQNISDLVAKKTELLSLAANEAALTALATGSSSAYLKPSAGGANFSGAGNISLASQKSLQLGSYTTAQQTTFVASLVAADKGKTWFNADTNMIMYWDGSSAKALGSATAMSSFNGSTQVSQSLSVGSSGTTPAWVTDAATGVHTLNLPLASSTGVTAGLLSYTEYDALAPKAYCDAKLAGESIPAPGGAEDGKALRWNNTAQAWEYFSPTSGAVTSLTGAAPLAVGGTAAAPQVSLSIGSGLAISSGNLVPDFGTAAGKVVEGDDARITGALQATTFNTYVSGVAGASACTTGQMMYWNSVSSAFACANISIGAGQIGSGVISAARLPAASETADGVVTQTAQTFAGEKTFANNVNVDGSLAVTGSVAIGGVALTSSQLTTLQAIATTQTAGTACAAGEKIATNSAGAVLACVSGTWQISGGGAASNPSSFSFTDQAGLAFNTLACSNSVTIAGLNIPVYASVTKFGTGSPYIKINGAGTTSTTYGTVQTGDTLQVCATSAIGNLALLSVPVTVGSYTTTWNLTTGNKTPSAFSFGTASVPASVSMPVTNCTTANISGLTLPSLVTASANGGATVTELNINNAGWAAYTGSQTIQNNQSLCVKITTSNTPSQAHTVTVNIGGSDGLTPVSTTWSVNNPVQDTSPDAFNFTNVTGTNINALTTSNSLTITGITGSVPVSVSGSGAPQISINGGAWGTSGTIQNNQTLQMRLTSSGTWNTSISATVTLGTGSSTWTVTSAACNSGSQLFTSSGTFTVPLACTTFRVLVVGGGGAGGQPGGGWQAGGAGSGYAYTQTLTGLTAGSNISVSVGGGGGYPNGGGGASSFGAYQTANGGQGGPGAQGGNGGNGGSGGGGVEHPLGGGNTYGGSGGGNGGNGGWSAGGTGMGGSWPNLGIFTVRSVTAGAGGSVTGGGGGGVNINGTGGLQSGGNNGQGYGAGSGNGSTNNGADGVVYIEWTN